MRFLLLLIFLFILLPVLELAAFSIVGVSIGFPATLLIIIITGMLGITLARRAGWQALQQLRQASLAGRNPSEEILHGLILLLAGLALLIPGFVTDCIGVLLLIPPMQKIAGRLLKSFFPQLADLAPAPDSRSGRTSEVNASELVIDVTAHDVQDADPEQ